MKIKINDILISKNGIERKVLEVFTQTVLTSEPNLFSNAGGNFSFEEIEKLGWKVKETTWSPSELKVGDTYWFISSSGDVRSEYWTSDESDKFRLKLENIYKDRESAEEALNKILNS